MSKNGHFNAANVWGTIVEVKPGTDTDKSYCDVQINCSGKYGTVNVFGRVWGDGPGKRLVAFHKQHPGELARFRGFFSQYTKRGNDRVFNNFVFFKWDLADDGQKPRAAFILTGQVAEIDLLGKESRIKLQLARKGAHGNKEVKESFEIWSFLPEVLKDIQPNCVAEFKGYLQQGQGEDEFGTATGEVKPSIMRSRLIAPPF